MNLEQSQSIANLQIPVMNVTGIRKSRIQVAKRVFQLAASGGHPYRNHSPESWAKKWLKSKEFVLMEIDINAAACVHMPGHPEGVSHYFQCSTDSMDPIVVDGNKRRMGRTALGYIPEVTVHDGKHRLKAQRMQGHTRIMAWVGTKVIDRIKKRGGVEIHAAAWKKYKKSGIIPSMNKTEVAYELYAATVPSVGLAHTVTRQSTGEGGSRPRNATANINAKKKMKAGGPGSGRRKELESLQRQAEDSAHQANTAEERAMWQKKAEIHQREINKLQGMGGGGTAGGSSASGGSGSNPLRMGIMSKKQKVKAADCNACGARSSGSLEDESASDDKVPPDPSDTKQRVDPSDRRKFNPTKPQLRAPGTRPGQSNEYGLNDAAAYGSNIGPRIPNGGASKSDFSRGKLTVNAMGHEVACMCGMCMKSKKNMDASGLKVKTINMKAPPGREDQVMELKKKYGEGSPIPFQIAWDQYQSKKHN